MYREEACLCVGWGGGAGGRSCGAAGWYSGATSWSGSATKWSDCAIGWSAGTTVCSSGREGDDFVGRGVVEWWEAFV